MKTIQTINHQSKARAIGAIIFSILIIVLVYFGVTIRLFDASELTGNEGVATYRMFTIDSNVLVSACALLCIPCQIEGILNNNFHMPRWLVYILYVGTTAVSMTFLIAVAVLSPVAGFKEMLFKSSNLYLHFICPILAMVLFTLVAHDHHVKFKTTFIAMIPIFLYATVYAVMAFMIGEENGGWRDHYRFNVYLPWPVTALLMILVAFGIATGLRVVHNKVHKSYKNNIRKDYLECEEFKDCTPDEIIKKIAHENGKSAKKNQNIPVPTRLINLFIENRETDLSANELSKIYVDEYLMSEQLN